VSEIASNGDGQQPSLLGRGQTLLREHEGLWGLLVIPFLAVQLLSVSRGSTTTALTILQAAGTLDVAVGVAVVSLPIVLVMISIWMGVMWVEQRQPLNQVGPGVAIVYFFLVALTPWPLLVLAVPVFGLVLIFQWLYRRYARPERPDSMAPMILGSLVIFLVYAAVAPVRPWMPAEAVITDSDAVVGYVLFEVDEHMVVLRDSDRQVIRLDRSPSMIRLFCDVEGTFSGRRLLDVVSRDNQPTYPRCDSIERGEPG
jgi:hypothetical protein